MSNLYPPEIVGGYEVECHDVVEHLRRTHAVTVLTSVRGRGRAPAERDVLRRLPFVRFVKHDSLRAPWLALSAVRATRRTLAEVRPDLVYVWNGSQLPFAALRVLERSGLPVAYRICEHWFGGLYSRDAFLRHLTPGERGVRGVWARAMRLANRHPELRIELDRVVPAAICWNAEAVRAATPVPATLRPVHEALVYPSNARTAAFAEVRPRPADPPTIFFAGRLDGPKGAEVLLRALPLLRERHGHDASLLLAGEGPLRGELAALAARLGVADHVRMPGPLRGDELLGAVSRAAAWVVPSVWAEPAPLVCTEAALARVPAVLSRVGGIGEMLREEEHALFFAKGDHEGCAAALARTLEDPEATRARVQRAYARGQELGHGPYLRAMDRFLDDALAALT